MSTSFDFLITKHPKLHDFVTQAAQYAYSDPQACIVKLRCFGEQLVDELYHSLGLTLEGNDNFFERLKNPALESVLDKAITYKLHALRTKGNAAAHSGKVSQNDALWLLKEAYLLGKWLVCTYQPDLEASIPAYIEPAPMVAQINAQIAPQAEHIQSKALEQAKADLLALQDEHTTALASIQLLNQAVAELEQRQQQFALANQVVAQQIDLEMEITLQHLSLEDAFAEYQLNDDQKALVAELQAFFNDPTKQVFILKGYAGTGKTFITKGLTEYLRSIGRQFNLMAPTGKAARVISKKTGCYAFTVHRTIYSFKDIREYKEPELDGSETFKYYATLRANELPDNTVYIADEASMLGDVYQDNEFFRFGSGFLLSDLMKFINFDHNDHSKKLIVIGDSAQLPPVGMNSSPALDASYLKQKFNVNCAEYELTHVVRQQADSGVMANALMLRDSMAQGVFNQLDFKLDFPDVIALKHEQLVANYLQACNHEPMSNQAVILCGSNADVKHYNDRIREEFFPGKTVIQPRDKLIMIKNTEVEGHHITNGEFVYVTACSDQAEQRAVTLKTKNAENITEQRVIELSFRRISFAFRDENDAVKRLECMLLETLLNSSEGALNSDQQKALYVDFCIRTPQLKMGSKEFKDALLSDPYFNALRAKYGYAITVHKAQGSEWPNVFVKCKTPQYSTLSHVYFRWFYTAITRTSAKLYVLDEPHILPGSGLKKAMQKDFSWLSDANSPNNQPLIQAASSQHQEVKQDINAPAGSVSTLQMSGTPKQATDFGIPASEGFLVALFNEINHLLQPLGAEITGIAHNQYQERYFIERQQDQACININYSGKNKVTRVQYVQLNEFNAEISALLSTLVNKPLALVSEGSSEQLSEAFMQQLYQRLESVCHSADITIAGVTERPFCLEFSFSKGTAFTCINIYYDGKKRFTRYQYAQGKSNSAELTQTIEALIDREIAI